VNTESIVMLILSGVVTVVGGILILMGRFALTRMDEALKDMAELKGAVLGVEGRGGLLQEMERLRDWRNDDVSPMLARHESDIGQLKQDRNR
jgi:hypothetical protein